MKTKTLLGWMLAVVLLGTLAGAGVGCEASGKVDDDGVKAKVDTK